MAQPSITVSDPPRPWRRWAWAPVAGLAAAILVLGLAGPDTPWEVPWLVTALNLLFATVGPMLVLWLVVRSFLARGRPGYLLLGCGVLVWAAAFAAAGLEARDDVNRMVTIHNLGAWLAALCHLAGVVLEGRRGARTRLAPAWLLPAWLLSLAGVALVVLAARQGWVAPFFVQGQGGTQTRQVVLGSALATFAASAVLLSRQRGRTAFAFWYSLALWLIVAGLTGVWLQAAAGSAVSWAGRAAQYLGGAYMVAAALAALKSEQDTVVLDLPGTGAGFRIFTALLLVAVATALHVTLRPVLGDRAPFIMMYPAVVLACLLGGFWAGLAATLAAGLVCKAWLPAGAPLGTSILLGIFTGNGLLMALTISTIHRYRARVADLEARALASAVREEGQLALGRTVAELTRSNRDLEQFAYVASHDLQEPARMVHIYVDLLRTRCADHLDPKAEQYFGFLEEATTRMQALIRDLLSYARLGAADAQAARAEVDLQTCLDAALADLQEAVAAGHAVVTWDPLPRVRGDAGRLTRLLTNLIGNALKFHGEAPPRIHIGVRPAPEGPVLFVRDNGIGIPQVAQQRIFDIFQRLHDRQSYPGTGIGLAICKKIVEDLGGRIWVESEPGQGATFLFTLPGGP